MLFAIGPAGSGKTNTAIALAVRSLKNKEIKKIILSRPAVEAGEKLGFLPGDKKDKIDPKSEERQVSVFNYQGGPDYRHFFPDETDIIDKIAGSEIITSIYNDVVGTDNFIRILFSQSCGIGIDLYIMVQGFKTFLGLDSFGHAYLGFTIKYLTLQVADTYHIIVY